MIVVTGATGHIGNTLVRALLARGEEVRCLVLPGEDLRPLEGLGVELREGDVRQREALDRTFRGARVVYHLASVIDLLPRHAGVMYEVNVGGTRNVVEACLACGVERLVYTGSIHALAEPPEGVTMDESAPPDPARIPSHYGKSKALATLEVLEGVKRGLDAVVVSPSGVVGPHDFRPSDMGRLILDFMRRRLWAYVEGAYDFVDVRDVAEGHLAACTRGTRGENYILSGERVTVRQMMEWLAEITGVPAPRLCLPSWAARVVEEVSSLWAAVIGGRPRITRESLRVLKSNSYISHAKATRELGYHPRPLRESLADTVEWFREVGWGAASV
ncbi:MAG: SDR family oxidoreductase [Bacillota bacterium]